MSIGGRVHSNANVYVDPSAEVSFASTLTASGDIYNYHESGYALGGTVLIKDATGTDQAMAGLDSDSPDWASESITRWGGRVRSGETGGDRVELVIEDPSDPRLIIEAGRSADTAADQAAKIWYDAGLRIVNGRGYDQAGNVVSLVNPSSGTDAVRYSTIFDWREQKYMLTVEVDMETLRQSPGYPANGVVYLGAFQPDSDMPSWPGVSVGVGPAEWEMFPAPWTSTTTEFAFKTRNASELAGPLTLVTENPLYVHGSFNTVNKQPAAIMTDALTILSNNWGDVDDDGIFDDDLTYSLQDLSSRTASDTTVNAAIITGNVDMGASYNGGLENLPRLLERWANVPLNLLGSLAALWESEYGNGIFGNSNVYAEALRNWNFDSDFLDLSKLPPETPRIYKITVTGWTRH